MPEKSRILTLEQVRRAGACLRGRKVFRREWGIQAVINQAWARQVAPHLDWYDADWCARCLLPCWAAIIYFRIRCSYFNLGYFAFNRVCWAIFAALYVECGDE